MYKKVKKETLNELLNLCELYDDGLYRSKHGVEYLTSLKHFLNSKNKNDNPFTDDDIIIQPQKKDFKFEGLKDFKYVCELYAEPMVINLEESKKQNEKIFQKNLLTEYTNLFYDTLGIVYLITCEIKNKEYIIKIGSTRTTFNDRLSSYNCGVITNIRSASTTNIKIMQSFITTNRSFKLYLLDCSAENKEYDWYGKKSVEFASSMALAYEDILLKEFKEQFKKIPLANVQANATQRRKQNNL